MNRRAFLGLMGGAALGWATRGEAEEARLAPGCIRLSPPTGQTVLDGSIRQGVFMDTGTGRPESGMFGNTRKYADGSARFHEGIDIAPVQPWRRDRNPTDVVRAAAAGLVVYINRCQYNPSLYGNYVVLAHPVEGFGEVYTLYAHLRKIDDALRAGQNVPPGRALGVMGHTPDFPLARAHLHFEIGVMMNRFYYLIDPQHGVWNGANLYGIDPCDAFAEQRKKGFFDIAAYIKARPIAWATVLSLREKPDFFKRYPSLWNADRFETWQTLVLFSREGIPVSATSLDPKRIYKLPAGSAAELRKGRDWSEPKRQRALIENLLVSPKTPNPTQLSKPGEVG